MAVLVALLAPVAALGDSASAAPATRVQDVQKRIENLEMRAAQAAEDYNASRERIAALKVRAAAARARVQQQQRRVQAARRELGVVAAETYKGGSLSALELFLGDDPDAVLATGGTLTTLTERRSQAVARLRTEQAALAKDLADVQAQSKRLTATRSAMKAARARVLSTLAATRAELGRLQERELATLVRTSRDGDRAALARVLGRALPASGRVTCEDVNLNPPTPRVAKVLEYACDHLGDRYVWGAAGPSTFDCSGLTQMAWKQVGVSLPHNAAMQSKYGTRVAAEDLRPGDLVFYNTPISHMGMYIGSGLMIHAPRTGDVVRIAPVRYGKLVAAVRL